MFEHKFIVLRITAPIATSIEDDVQNISLKSKDDNNVRKTLQSNGALDHYESFDLTPVIGKEYPTANLVEWINSPNADELLRELAYQSMHSHVTR